MIHITETFKPFRRALILLSCLFLFKPALANENAWPQLDKNVKTGICSQALDIARATFHSNSFYLYAPATMPKNISSKLVLGPSMVGASEDNLLIIDPSVFLKIPIKNEHGKMSIYWQLKAQEKLRYVISENTVGWRGNQYALFAIDENISLNQLNLEEYPLIYNDPKVLIPVTEEGWRPPLMLQEKDTKTVWAIDVGETYTFLSDWTVYSFDRDGIQQRCLIHFHPESTTAITLLPEAVQKLSRLLDKTLGDNREEGTSHFTNTINTKVMYTWANVALRPWAVLKESPYNSRVVVDAGLKKWSLRSRASEKIYHQISVQYHKAEYALADYYKKQFDYNTEEAHVMAKQALDIAFRMYFIFPEEKPIADED